MNFIFKLYILLLSFYFCRTFCQQHVASTQPPLIHAVHLGVAMTRPALTRGHYQLLVLRSLKPWCHCQLIILDPNCTCSLHTQSILQVRTNGNIMFDGNVFLPLVSCDFDISPPHSDQRRRYRQSEVGSLLVSPRLFVRQIFYEHLQKNRLDATLNAWFPRDVVQHVERNVSQACGKNHFFLQQCLTSLPIPSDDTRGASASNNCD